METMSSAVATLQQWAKSSQLGQASLSSDGTSLSLGDTTLNASEKQTIEHGGKTCEYSLASIFLQILDPNQSLVKYRGACKKHSVKDFVKASDKATVVGCFLGEEQLEGAVISSTAAPETVPDESKPPPPSASTVSVPPPPAPPSSTNKSESSSSKNRSEKKRRHSDKEKEKNKQRKHEKSSRSRADKAAAAEAHRREKKARKANIDTKALFQNLSGVVDKRSIGDAKLESALSPEGFSVTPELLQQYREPAQLIMANEIPVGDSQSILQAAAGKDLSRILKLYLDTISPPKGSSKSGPSAQVKSSHRQYLVGKKPIIIVPKGMTAPITIINAHAFFGESKFIPRDVIMKQKGVSSAKTNAATTFSRKVGPRLGGGKLEYEIMDNPKSKLQNNPKEWERIVAVICLGASWQFKDWPAPYNHPVHLFDKGRTFGFFIGMEGANTPSEIEGWSVQQAKLNRDKRGLDSVTYASFWNGLDEFMAIHKPELLPQDE